MQATLVLIYGLLRIVKYLGVNVFRAQISFCEEGEEKEIQ